MASLTHIISTFTELEVYRKILQPYHSFAATALTDRNTVFVDLDISSAYNNVSVPSLLSRLALCNIPWYLTGVIKNLLQKWQVHLIDRTNKILVAPLKNFTLGNVRCFGYANDFVLIGSSRNQGKTIPNLTVNIANFSSFPEKIGLQLSLTKCQTICFRNPNKPKPSAYIKVNSVNLK